MCKRRCFFLLLLGLGLLVGVIAFGAFRQREPEYGGKKLSEWVRSYHYQFHLFDRNAEHVADEPIGQIGTNAVPHLLRWMRYETPLWKSKLYAALNPIIRPLNPAWQFDDWKQRKLADCSVCALKALGPRANNAVGPLAKMANGPLDQIKVQRAIYSLPALGEVGPLLVCLTNVCRVNGPARWRAMIISVIGSMEMGARPAIPTLEQFLTDPDPSVKDTAAAVLRKIDPTLRRGR